MACASVTARLLACRRLALAPGATPTLAAARRRQHPTYEAVCYLTPARRHASAAEAAQSNGSCSDGVLAKSTLNGVTTLRFNDPKRLNGWTSELVTDLLATFTRLADSPETKALIITGTGTEYFSAGANLSGGISLQHPRTLFNTIRENNRRIFAGFLDFPKPIVVAVNGRAIGAPVTSASLCDAIVAVQHATFETPFKRLGLFPEGCSSVHFARLMGEETARQMLEEGRRLTAAEALQAGLVTQVVATDEELQPAAQALAERWVAEGRPRTLVADGLLEEYRRVNEQESITIAEGILSRPFLQQQRDFLRSRGKDSQARMFDILDKTHFLWRRLV